jgi:preprotein translocase subunit Sss1
MIFEAITAVKRKLKENERKRIEQAKARKRKQIKEWTTGIVVTIAALSAVGIFGYILYWLIVTKGKL